MCCVQLTFDDLSKLLNNVDKPLKMERPNHDKIARMEIPMCQNHEVHLVDVASAVVKEILGKGLFILNADAAVRRGCHTAWTALVYTPVKCTYWH